MYFTYGSVCTSMLLSACVPLSPSLLTFQQTGIYQCQLFKTFSVSQPSCTFIQPVNYENLPCKKLYDFFKWLSSFSSVDQSCLTLRPHELQHARPPCPSPTPRVYSNSCPLSQWCHWTISSSVVPFSSCLQLFPASGSFQISQLFKRAQKTFKFFFELRMIGLLDT